MKKLILPLILLILTATLLSITPQEAVKLAFKNNPSLKELQVMIDKAEYSEKKAFSAYLPKLSFFASYKRAGIIPEFEMPGAGKIRFGTENNYFLQLKAEYLLFDWGRRGNILKISSNSKNFPELNLNFLKKSLVNSIFSLFIAYKTLSLTEETLISNLKTLEKHLSAVKELYRAGIVSKHDLLSTEVKIEDAKGEIDDIKKAKENILIALKEIISTDSIDTPVISELKFKLPLDPEKLLEISKKNREDLKLFDYRRKNLELQKKIAKTKNLPLLAFQANYMLQNGMLPDLNEMRSNWNVMITLSSTLFDGFKSKYELYEIESEIKKLDYEYEEKIQKIKSDIEKSIKNIKFLEEKIKREEKKVFLSKESLEIVEKAYNEGSKSNLDVLKAIAELKFSELSLIKAKADLEKEKLKLSLIVGIEPWRLK